MKNIFILLFAPTTFIILYDFIFYYIPIVNNNYNYISTPYIYYMIFIDIFSIIIFTYLFIKQKKIKSDNNYSNTKTYYLKTQWYLFIFLLIFVLIHYLIIHVFGTISYSEVINNYGKFYAVSKRGTAWVFYLINILLITLLYDLYLNSFTKTKLFFVIVTIIMIATTGGRSSVMTLIMFLFFIYVVIHNRRLNLWILSLGTSLIMVFFVANSVLRAKTDLVTYLQTNKSSFDFDQAYTLNDVIKKQEEVDTYFIDTVDLMYMFIPRKIWEEKPMSTAATRLVYPDISDRGTSITFGLYANVLMNIGYFGFLFIPLFIFLF